MPVSAEIICDSTAKHSPRLTTFKLRYPKFVHAEFMTHRAFSRNASSSRAVPVAKNLVEVRDDTLRAEPMFWGAEQKGMSPGSELSSEELKIYEFVDIPRLDPPNSYTAYTTHLEKAKTPLEHAKLLWKKAALEAAANAEALHWAGAHKSLVNRIIEPFLHINVVVTSC